MPEEPPIIDLKPGPPRYPNGAPRSYGRVHTGQMVFSLIVALGFLALAYFNRSTISVDVLVPCVALFGVLAGGALAIIFRRHL